MLTAHRSDLGLCLAITFTASVLPSDCSRPFSAGLFGPEYLTRLTGPRPVLDCLVSLLRPTSGLVGSRGHSFFIYFWHKEHPQVIHTKKI